MNATTRAMKERVQQEKRKRNTPVQTTINSNNARTVSVAITPTNIINVIVSKGISPYDVIAQIKDLIYTGFNLTQKKINLSNFTDCCYDLLFSKQEIKYKDDNTQILESYFCTV